MLSKQEKAEADIWNRTGTKHQQPDETSGGKRRVSKRLSRVGQRECKRIADVEDRRHDARSDREEVAAQRRVHGCDVRVTLPPGPGTGPDTCDECRNARE